MKKKRGAQTIVPGGSRIANNIVKKYTNLKDAFPGWPDEYLQIRTQEGDKFAPVPMVVFPMAVL